VSACCSALTLWRLALLMLRIAMRILAFERIAVGENPVKRSTTRQLMPTLPDELTEKSSKQIRDPNLDHC
jgi:hypothetical protein